MMPRTRSRLHRRDLPFLIAALILLLLFACSVAARAAGSALDQVADEVAKQVAGQVQSASWMSTLSNLTVGGVLWYFSRLFYADKKETDAKVLELTERYASLMERIAGHLDNLSDGKPSTGRFLRDQGHNAG